VVVLNYIPYLKFLHFNRSVFDKIGIYDINKYDSQLEFL
jgi:hypothetical protein